jgi:hypothetical protein
VEVIGLRLYTGPMFALYNAKMRSFPANMVEYLRLLGPRAFVTTLHAVNSGILKMARFSVVPGRPRPCRPCMNCLCVCEGVGCEGGREVQRVGEWVGPQLNLSTPAVSHSMERVGAEDGFVYRGLSGLELPRNFIVPNAFGTRSGVEVCFCVRTCLTQ